MGLFRKTKYLLPKMNDKAASLVVNDKLVFVVGAGAEEIKPALSGFCKLYNRNDYKIEIKLHPVEEKVIALTFPDNLDYIVFFYLIKNLTFLNAGRLPVKVMGWCSLLPIDKTVLKTEQVMVFAPDTGHPGKFVYLTTQENKCWKIDFDRSCYEPVSLLQPYNKPPYSFMEIKHREGYLLP